MDWLNLATKIALDHTPVANARVVAIVTRRGEVIAIGWNQKKTHPLQARFAIQREKIWLHAEVDALRKAKQRVGVRGLRDCEMWVGRVKKDEGGRTRGGLAEPCLACKRALYFYRMLDRTRWTVGGEEIY